MKKLKRIGAAIGASGLLAFTLTGCMSMNVDVVINDDYTAEVSASVGYDKSALSGLLGTDSEDATICDQISEKMNEEGEVSENEKVVWEETDTHCVMKTTSSKPVAFNEKGLQNPDLTNFDEQTDPNAAVNDSFQIVKEGKNARVTFNAKDFTDAMNTGESGVSWDMLVSEFNLSVTFPQEITDVNNNGVLSDDKKTVTWDLKNLKNASDSDGVLTVVGGVESDFNLIPLVIGGVALIVIVVGVALFIVVFKKKKSTEETLVA